MYDFAHRILKLQELSGLNQQDFAEFCNVSKSTMSRYQSGKMNPSLDQALDIAIKCNVTLDWLVGYGPIDSPERRTNGLQCLSKEI